MRAGLRVHGEVARTTLRDVEIGRRATLTRDPEWVTLRQGGAVVAKWSAARGRVRMARTQVVRRTTPVWAIVLGILLLPVFLVGVLLFFVKQEGYVPLVTAIVFVDGDPVVTLERHGLVLHQETPAVV